MTFNDLVFGQLNEPWLVMAACFAASIAGMLTHFYKKVTRDGVQATLREWFVTSDIKSTFTTIASVLVSTFIAIAPYDVGSLTLWGAVTLGFPIGYMSDSAFNGLKKRFAVTEDAQG